MKQHCTDRAKLAARIGYRAKSYRGKFDQANALFAFTLQPVIEHLRAGGPDREEDMMPNKVNTAWRRIRVRTILALAAASFSGFQPLAAATQQAPAPAPRPAYARIADLVTTSGAIAVVGVKKLTDVPAERAPGLPAGFKRYIVDVDTITLIRGNDVLAKQASFLIDLPGDPKSKPPKWKGRIFLIFGKVDQRVDFFQLLSSQSVIDWSQDNESFVRKVAADLSANNAPPVIQSIDSVFHVTGAVAGEGESQIFLTTADNSTISLSIIRKPDEKPQFGVSLGEIVDDAAALPARDTPLWYRLACFLPDRVPQKALQGQASADATAAAKDYADFLKAVRPCDREPQSVQ